MEETITLDSKNCAIVAKYMYHEYRKSSTQKTIIGDYID